MTKTKRVVEDLPTIWEVSEAPPSRAIFSLLGVVLATMAAVFRRSLVKRLGAGSSLPHS